MWGERVETELSVLICRHPQGTVSEQTGADGDTIRSPGNRNVSLGLPSAEGAESGEAIAVVAECIFVLPFHVQESVRDDRL